MGSAIVSCSAALHIDTTISLHFDSVSVGITPGCSHLENQTPIERGYLHCVTDQGQWHAVGV